MARVAGVKQLLDWIFYDSFTTDGTIKEVTLFQVAVGDDSKTLVDTNMRATGKLPSGHTFRIWGLSIHTQPDETLANLVALLKDAVLTVVIGEKDQIQVPLIKLTGGAGIQGLTTGTSVEAYHNGVGDPRAIFTLKNSIDIEDDEVFRVEIKWTTAPTTGAKAWVNLEGELRRTVG